LFCDHQFPPYTDHRRHRYNTTCSSGGEEAAGTVRAAPSEGLGPSADAATLLARSGRRLAVGKEGKEPVCRMSYVVTMLLSCTFRASHSMSYACDAAVRRAARHSFRFEEDSHRGCCNDVY
jgi:hypothetical protein